MRKIREILRLRWERGLSHRQIAESCAIAPSTVSEYMRRAQAARLSWPLPPDLDDSQLEALLFPPPAPAAGGDRPHPKWEEIHEELRKKGVTLALLWQEYKAQHPDGYQYSFFCDLYRDWAKKLDPCMRHAHKAGERLFIDYCGQTAPVTDPATGEIREAQIFVAVLGASNYTYAEATWTQSLPDWIASHVRAFEFLGACPELVVLDNLKSGVTHACRYEPETNPTYQDLANHYGIAVLPTRVRKPRDKAKVETGVQIVERWILAPLRHRQFFSLHELNQAIRVGVEELNQRPFQKIPGCRQSLFESLDRPALRPLPAEPYEFAEWKKARVNLDYHIEVGGHYYSVPYKFLRQQIDVRITARTIECFLKGKRIASHVRSLVKGGYTTVREHMPKSHQAYCDWTPDRLVTWGESIGPNTAGMLRSILKSRAHPAQGVRSCLGILRLAKSFGEDRLEKACERALIVQALSYKSICSILKNGLDRVPLSQPARSSPSIEHANIRGTRYFQLTQRRLTHADSSNTRKNSISETVRDGQGLRGTIEPTEH